MFTMKAAFLFLQIGILEGYHIATRSGSAGVLYLTSPDNKNVSLGPVRTQALDIRESNEDLKGITVRLTVGTKQFGWPHELRNGGLELVDTNIKDGTTEFMMVSLPGNKIVIRHKDGCFAHASQGSSEIKLESCTNREKLLMFERETTLDEEAATKILSDMANIHGVANSFLRNSAFGFGLADEHISPGTSYGREGDGIPTHLI